MGQAGSVGVLGIESHLDPLDLVAQLDGGPQLQLQALLHRGEGQQQERLAVDILPGDKAGLEPRRDRVHGGGGGEHVSHGGLHPRPRAWGWLSFPLSLQSTGREGDLA